MGAIAAQLGIGKGSVHRVIGKARASAGPAEPPISPVSPKN